MTRTAFCLIVALACCSLNNVAAKEPIEEFLAGLRARRYYDTALDYLDRLETHPAVESEFKEALDFERAITLMAAAAIGRDRAAQRRQLTEAQALLRQFVQQHPQHARANAARTQLGNLVAQQARLELLEAERDRRVENIQRARQLYREARQVFQDHQAALRTSLEAIPKVLDRSDEDQAALAARRTQLQGDYVQTQLFATAILEELSTTYDVGTQERTNLLTQAAGEYKQIYEKYRNRTGGLYARLYQGRAHQEMGKFRDALGYYVELLDQPDSPDVFRTLKTKTLRLAVDCWLHESQNKYIEVIRRCSQWLAKARPEEERQPDWLYLRLALARAHLKRAEAAQGNRETIAARNEAEKQAKLVARYQSDFQQEAQQILVTLGGRDRPERPEEIRDFAAAREAAKEALDVAEGAAATVVELENAGSEAKRDAATQLAAARQTLDSARSQAIAACERALQLADDETATEDVNRLRYLLAYLHYQQQDFFHAAVIGEFVARRFPASASAPAAANIALASYTNIQQIPSDHGESIDPDRVMSIAEFIAGRWPDRTEGQNALASLITAKINAHELEAAQKYLSQLPADSPQRADAELKLGVASWHAYLDRTRRYRMAQPATAGNQSVLPPELDSLKQSAHQLLAAGIERLPDAPRLDSAAVQATLYFAQSCLETGDVGQALSILSQPNSGPLTLVRAGHPATSLAGLVEDTYKTALRANILSLAESANPAAVIQQTQDLMNEMERAFHGSEDGQDQLMRIYVSLARDLEEQLETATPATRDALSQGFESFLAELSTTATELSVLNWVAETFASLGAGFDKGEPLDPTAKRYYDQSILAFRNVLERLELDETQRRQVQFRLANVKRDQRDFSGALDLLKQLLSDNSRTLNVQIEAARTLQQWAESETGPQSVSLYERAIQGDFRDERQQNIVWGWGRIAKATASVPQFRDSFHTARLSLVRCRIGMAAGSQREEKQRLLAMAKKDITLTERLYGLGDEQFATQYRQLRAEIEAAQGI